jgi:6-phosphofructokinase 1
MAGISTGADFLFIPENPPAENWRQDMSKIIMKHREMGKRTTIIIVAEGAIDRELNKISCESIKQLLSDELKLDTRVTTLGHVQRGGSPCFYDRMLGTLQGCEAVNAVLEANPTTPSPVISIIENKIVRQPLMEAVRLTQQVPLAIKAKDFDRAMQLRDAEFSEYFAAYKITSAVEQPELLLPENKVR